MHIERERERESEICVYTYIYIYIYVVIDIDQLSGVVNMRFCVSKRVPDKPEIADMWLQHLDEQRFVDW